MVDLSLDSIQQILTYQPVPGSDEYVDIVKTKATLSLGILNTASRVRDTELTKRVDDRLGQLLEELKRLEQDFGMRVLPGKSHHTDKSLSAPDESQEPSLN